MFSHKNTDKYYKKVKKKKPLLHNTHTHTTEKTQTLSQLPVRTEYTHIFVGSNTITFPSSSQTISTNGRVPHV